MKPTAVGGLMESSTGTTRRLCLTEEDDDLAYIAQPETAGFSGNIMNNHHQIPPPYYSRPLYPISSQRRRGSFRSLSFSSSMAGSVSPRFGGRFFDGRFEDLEPPPHFLEACYLCKKQIGDNKDIFMYRGDTPFCSEECRQEQIEIDEAKEKDWNISSMKKLRKKEQKKSSTSPNRAQQSPIRPGTVVAA